MEKRISLAIKRLMTLYKPVTRKVKISKDDPFVSIFIPKEEAAQHEGECDSSEEEHEHGHCCSDKTHYWKNSNYWKLPPNVRNAIDVAQMKKKHSDFYYKLRLLNDKIHVFTNIFYSKVPKYQMHWYKHQQKMLEERLKRQKRLFEDEMTKIDSKMQKTRVLVDKSNKSSARGRDSSIKGSDSKNSSARNRRFSSLSIIPPKL
jgi:hypothetical protein